MNTVRTVAMTLVLPATWSLALCGCRQPPPPQTGTLAAYRVTLSRNHQWSNGNDLPTSAAILALFGGRAPVIDTVEEVTRNHMAFRVIPVEIQGTIRPSSPPPPLADFGATQVLDLEQTVRFNDGTRDNVQRTQENDGAFVADELDLNGGRAIYYILDSPGAPRRLYETLVRNRANVDSITLAITATTTPTFMGRRAGGGFSWVVSVTCRRAAGGGVTWVTP